MGRKRNRCQRENPEREETEAMLRAHEAGLQEALNMRLLCGETMGETVFWVDEVRITEITYSPGKRKKQAKWRLFLSWLIAKIRRKKGF